MKIIHCADLHLDSRMETHLDSGTAKIRRTELLHNFSRLVSFAEARGVSAILIAGDLFDTRRVSATARNTVLGEIRNHPDIAFYYLRGNHDDEDALQQGENPLPNLFCFGEEWRSYTLGDSAVTITGAELREENHLSIYSSLVLSPDRINIVLLHGMLSEGQRSGQAEEIDLSSLRNKDIDYLALGHIHSPKEGKLLPRGEWAYPGCLEGRGLDEPGKHGFYLLEIPETERSIRREFVPFSQREVFAISVDVSGCMETIAMEGRISEACEAAGATERDYVRITLTGEVDAEAEKNLLQLTQAFRERFYVVKLEDRTSFHVDYRSYQHDASLKGEFIRLVQGKEDISEQEKAEIIRAGILSLREEAF